MASEHYGDVVRRAGFRLVWEELAANGLCDGLDGSEYRRVWEEWNEQGYWDAIEVFITLRANAPAAEGGQDIEERVGDSDTPDRRSDPL